MRKVNEYWCFCLIVYIKKTFIVYRRYIMGPNIINISIFLFQNSEKINFKKPLQMPNELNKHNPNPSNIVQANEVLL